MSATDLVTLGLAQASGLSLSTEGLLVVREAPAEPGIDVGSERKVDVRLEWRGAIGPDLVIEAGDLAPERSLLTSILLSLFLDRRATADELRASELPDDDPRGWWGNDFPEVEQDEYGSKLWLLSRAKQTDETLNRAREHAREALAWLLEDEIAERVEIEATYPDRGVLALAVEVVKPPEPAERFAFVWEM